MIQHWETGVGSKTAQANCSVSDMQQSSACWNSETTLRKWKQANIESPMMETITPGSVCRRGVFSLGHDSPDPGTSWEARF